MRLTLFILTLTLLTACGHKTDLRLPEPQEQAVLSVETQEGR